MNGSGQSPSTLKESFQARSYRYYPHPILAGFGRSSLNRRLIADGHDPMSVPLDPQAAYVDRLPRIRLVEARHNHGVAEIKHLSRYERCGRRTVASLLLQIESCDSISFA